MSRIQTRRRFLTTALLAGAASLVRAPFAVAAEGPLETTVIRLTKSRGICSAPQYVADELLRTEGFTDISYVDATPPKVTATLARGSADITMGYAAQFIRDIDSGQYVSMLGGVHVGCVELFAHVGIRSISDLKDKSVGVQAVGSLPNILVVLMAAHVGLDPYKDIHWVTDPKLKPFDLFVDGKIDAFLAFPPEPQDLRARGIGHVIVNTAVDRPWSQYYCCVLAGNPEFIRKYPVATKRAMRAILKATDLCASDPQGAARQIVDRGFTERLDLALQTLTEVPYDRWREYDPEDTVRFYALMLHDTGLIKSDPKRVIAENTDWRFFNELRRELKA